jgi:hypothetical protein
MTAADADFVKQLGLVCRLSEDSECTGIYFDVTRVGQYGLERSFRCLFYLVFQAWKKEKPVVLIRYSESPNLNRHMLLKLLGAFESMSLRVSCFLYVYKPPKGAKGFFDTAIAPHVEGFVSEFRDRGVRFQSIISEDPSKLLAKLSAEGFSADCLPISVGGKLKPEDIAAAYAARARIECFLSLEEQLMCAPADPGTLPVVVLEEMKMRGSVIDAVVALADMDKRVAFEAHSIDPDAVLAEIDPALLFRVFRGDARAAATRYVSYWKHRQMAFGDRYLLPLSDLGGEGALSRLDVDALETGFITFLPDDSNRRQVVFIDCARATHHCQDNDGGLCRARCIFFMLSNAALDADVVVYVRTSYRDDWDPSADALVCGIMSSMPTTIDSVVMLLHGTAGDQLESEKTFLAAQRVHSESLTFIRAFVDASSCDGLPGLGLSATGLPPSVGGTWSYDTFDQWIKDRKYPSQLQPVASEEAEQASNNFDADAQQQDSRTTKLSVATFARRLRKRERIAEDMLQRKCFALDSANQTLRDENRRLQQLLAECNASIAPLVSTSRSVPIAQTCGTAQAPRDGTGITEDSEQVESNPSNVRKALLLHQQRRSSSGTSSITDPALGASRPADCTTKRKRPGKSQSGEESAEAKSETTSPPFPASATPREEVRRNHGELATERHIGSSTTWHISDDRFRGASAAQALEAQRIAQSALLAERILAQSNAASPLSQHYFGVTPGLHGLPTFVPNPTNPSLSLLSNASSELTYQALLWQEPNFGQLTRSLAMSNMHPTALPQLPLQHSITSRFDTASSLLASFGGNWLGLGADSLNHGTNSPLDARLVEQLLAEILAARRRAN